MGRKHKELFEYPKNYTYTLYDVINKEKKSSKISRAVALSENDVRIILGVKRAKIRPTRITDLIKSFGHKKTHKLLKKFGNSWVCKEGRILYNEANQK